MYIYDKKHSLQGVSTPFGIINKKLTYKLFYNESFFFMKSTKSLSSGVQSVN